MIEKIYVKSMVCGRCIRVVKEEVEKLGYKINAIQLGEIEIESQEVIDKKRIRAVLEPQGFELLEDKVVQIIEQIKVLIVELVHYSKEPLKENYSEYLSKMVDKDYNFISSLFSEIENITIEKFIILQKIEKVKELLIYNELTLSEIAFQLGYSSVAYLSSKFKQVTGLTPTAFKKIKAHIRTEIDKI